MYTIVQTVQGAVLSAFLETVLQLLTILAAEGYSLCWALLFSGPQASHIPTTSHLFCKTCSFSPKFACSETHDLPQQEISVLLPSHKPHTTGQGREESSFSQKGLNSCLFAWGFPQSAQKQSCSTGSALNLHPWGFPLPAHRWRLPKPSASLMQKAPLVPSLLLPEASMWIWQSRKLAAFLPESPFCQSL